MWIHEAVKGIAKGIDCGYAQFPNIPANSYADEAIVFGHEFDTVPQVTATLFSSSTAPNMGRVSVAVNNITTTGCTVRVFNSDTASRVPGVSWIATTLGGVARLKTLALQAFHGLTLERGWA